MKLTLAVAERVLLVRLEEKALRANTVRAAMVSWRSFKRWVTAVHGEGWDLREATSQDAQEFVLWLRRCGKLTGEPLKAAVVAATVTVVRDLFASLVRKKKLLTNPFADLKVKPTPNGWKVKLSQEEMHRFLEAVSVAAQNPRDKVLFEVLYACALRPSEACQLKVCDVDVTERKIVVRQTKVGRDRVVALTPYAANLLAAWTLGKKAEEFVFGRKSRALSPHTINALAHEYAQKAEVEKPGLSAYSIRHSCATHLLENGADLRYVQEHLGHASLESTVIYTHQMSENVKRIYKSYHPRENELFKEIDEEYLKRWTSLKTDLEREVPRRAAKLARRKRIKQKALEKQANRLK